MSEPEKINVKVNDTDSVTALLYPAAKKTKSGTTIILGHGAGSNQLSPFMQLFAERVIARIALTTRLSRKEAHKFYEQIGYKRVCESAEIVFER